MLPVQYILGGKSDRCHPTSPPPKGDIFTHIESHWQNERTFMLYITKILVPFKDATIRSMGLPQNQLSMIKVDLHYSHKTPAVLKLLKENHFVVLYVPGRCTDEMQKCDTFKSGLKAGFRNYIHENFDNHKGEDKAQ